MNTTMPQCPHGLTYNYDVPLECPECAEKKSNIKIALETAYEISNAALEAIQVQKQILAVLQEIQSSLQKAELNILSTPPGADIELAGAFVGNTPSTIGVIPGLHLIKIRKSGYDPWKKQVFVRSGSVTLAASLTPLANPPEHLVQEEAERREHENLAEFLKEAGDKYFYGEGVACDYDLARNSYEQSAAAGGVEAMRQLGVIHREGLGVKKNLREAQQWFLQTAELGDADSMNSLGYLYEHAQGVPQDYSTAKEWYEEAATKGSFGAMHNLGLLYQHGRGVIQDYRQARHWFEKSAEQGFVASMRSLGILYEYGQGVQQDDKQAFQWYERAASGNSVEAAFNLAILYDEGRGTAKDSRLARIWYEKAARGGNAYAKAKLNELK